VALDCLPLTAMSVPKGHLVNKLDSRSAGNAQFLPSAREHIFANDLCSNVYFCRLEVNYETDYAKPTWN
jgi:hypothetical protein